MNYNEFTSKLHSGEHIRSYGHLIEMLDGVVTIDGELTKFKSLEEARENIKQEYAAHKIEEQVSKELYEEISDAKVASIIKEYHDVKVTDTLIETYIQLASSNMFSVDPVVQDIRALNKLDTIVEGKLHYVLADDTIVAISEQTQERLNKLLGNQTEIIEYMRESTENFLSVLEQIEE
jgi:nitrogenase subunit NifH